MGNEIVKQEGMSIIQVLRQLKTLDGDDQLSIVKTAVKDAKSGLIARGLSVIQRSAEENFLAAFIDELEVMRQAGQIRENVETTDVGRASFRELFEMLDGKPDEERFRAFCALFMSANAPYADANDTFVDLELMGILRKLSAGEMHVLTAFLRQRTYIVGQDGVSNALARQIGSIPTALIDRNAVALVQQNLVIPTWIDGSGNHGTQKALLTDLGEELLNRVEKYNRFKNAAPSVAR